VTAGGSPGDFRERIYVSWGWIAVIVAAAVALAILLA